jgi:hypothetical protein
MVPIIAPTPADMAQVPDADMLTGAMHQDLPQRARLTGGIDGQPPHHPRRTPRWTSPAI